MSHEFNQASIGKIILGGYPHSFLNGSRKPMVFDYGFQGDKEVLDGDDSEVNYSPNVVPLTEIVTPMLLDGVYYLANPALLDKIDLGPGPVTMSIKTPDVLVVGSGGQFRKVSGSTLYYPADNDRPAFISTNAGTGNRMLLQSLAEFGIDAEQHEIGRAYRLRRIKVPEIVVQGASGKMRHILPASQLVVDNLCNPVKLLPISEVTDKERAAVYIANQESGRKTTEVIQQMCMVENDIAQFHKLHKVSEVLDNNFENEGSSLILA